ncbi:MAG: hypothetical protein KBD17_00390 [Candidatus Pacebacteria bacterium]|nr:hypothetical protein [Candidatus Paceibacterota bacterium]
MNTTWVKITNFHITKGTFNGPLLTRSLGKRVRFPRLNEPFLQISGLEDRDIVRLHDANIEVERCTPPPWTWQAKMNNLREGCIEFFFK